MKAKEEYQKEIAQIDPKDLIFIDESGVNTSMDRAYARAPEGQRAYAYRPYQKGNNVTIVGALSYQGIEASMTIEGYMDGECFIAFVNQVLVPQLKIGNVVVLDNLSSHKAQAIRTAIESKGARLLYLPPYSPEFSPIELCWSKVKTLLRSFAARDHDLLQKAISIALDSVSKFDAVAWFAHCGYCIHFI